MHRPYPLRPASNAAPETGLVFGKCAQPIGVIGVYASLRVSFGIVIPAQDRPTEPTKHGSVAQRPTSRPFPASWRSVYVLPAQPAPTSEVPGTFDPLATLHWRHGASPRERRQTPDLQSSVWRIAEFQGKPAVRLPRLLLTGICSLTKPLLWANACCGRAQAVGSRSSDLRARREQLGHEVSAVRVHALM
jgi:hypothetical protein